MKVPKITFWRETVSRQTATEPAILAVHAIRNWDRPSNGVFLLVVGREYLMTWAARQQAHDTLTKMLEQREKRLFAEYGHWWRDHLTEFFDDDFYPYPDEG